MNGPRLCIFAFVFAAGLQAQSVAEAVNAELPKWLRFGGEYRARLEGFTNLGFRPNSQDHYLLNRVRLNLKIEPVDWMRFVFQAQDSRVFANGAVPDAPPYKDSIGLRMGYLELGDPESRPLSLRAGRQELAFGEQRLVGHTSWNNVGRTFDAVRATLRWRHYRVDAFASSVVNVRDGEFNRPVTGNNFHGLYATSGKLVPRSTVDAYLLWRVAPGLDFKTIGTRWAGKPGAGFDYGVEMAAQTGDVRAWAGHWLAGYTLSAAAKPRLIAEYNYATGDDNPNDNRRRTFDTLYPTPHDKHGLTDQVGWRNIHHLRFGVELKPHPKWTAATNFHDWRLATTRDALYNAVGVPIARVPGGDAPSHVGSEVNVQAIWNATPRITLGAGLGHIFPGGFLKRATPGRGYTFPYVMLTYTL